MARPSSLTAIPVEDLLEIVSKSTSMANLIDNLGFSKSGMMYKRVREYLANLNIDYSHFVTKSVPTERTPENIFIEDSTANQTTTRKYYLAGNYSEYCCSLCSLPPEWQGKPLSLSLDHVNGNNKDNRLKNLRWVCPNCDRQLPTFGSKNRTKSPSSNG